MCDCAVVLAAALATAGVAWLDVESAATPMAMANAMAVAPMAVSSVRGVMVCSFLSLSGFGVAPLTCLLR